MLRRLVLAMLVALAVARPAAAARGPDQRCQDAVATAGRRVVARSLAILASCQRAVHRGTRPAGTDCLAATARRRATVDDAVRRIASACAAATFTPGGDCAGAGTAAARLSCLAESHDADVATLVGVADAARGKLHGPARRCQETAIREVGDAALAHLRLVQHCKRRPPAGLRPGTPCASAAGVVARFGRVEAAATRRIIARCSAAALAGARFGPPCEAPAGGGSLAACLLSAASSVAEAAVAAEMPDTGFCGDAGATVEQRIDDFLAPMSVADKVELMHGSGNRGPARTPGNAAFSVPGLTMIDGARGVGILAGQATAFPVAMARGATWDPALEQRVGDAIGVEARAKGASVILAPVLNILRQPRWGRAQETYGEDTFHLGRMGVGFIRGAQAHVIASAKHFAANSIENQRFFVDVTIDERTLREVYLPHFRAAVQDGHTGSVMSAYNSVNGQHCGENVHLLHDVLKGDWGFAGFVESDWILGTRSTVPSAVAGLDIEMPLSQYYGRPLTDAVTAGQVPVAAIDAAVRRILRAQLCFRLDTDPPQPDPSQVNTQAHADLAREVAQKSMVLLKNAQAALPLDRSTVRSLAVVGTLASMADLGDVGSSVVVPSHSVTPLDGIRAAAGGVTVTSVPVATLSPTDRQTVAAADAAVVVVGLTFMDEGEGLITHGDRDGLVLPRSQDDLVTAVAAANARTIVVLEGSGPVTMPWVDDVAAVLMAWYPGQEGGTAIADVLFGDVTPSGKLPVSFPRAEQDLPPFDNQSLAVTYGYYHGYRWLDRNGTAPLFPFGFGLSYTTFAYTNLTVAPATVPRYGRVRVTADVANTGTVAGDEIAQLYVGYRGSRVDRAAHDLRGFTRVHLAPGETKTIVFDVRAADLAFWDTAAGGWEIEPIAYEVAVGPSSRDLPLQGTFAVEAR